MRIILNTRIARIPPSWILDAARLQWLTVTDSTIVGVGAEKTMVIECDHDPQTLNGYVGVHGQIRRLAASIGEQVIACWKPETGRGVMLGATIDLDDAWGEFNPERFFLLDGTHPTN